MTSYNVMVSFWLARKINKKTFIIHLYIFMYYGT